MSGLVRIEDPVLCLTLESDTPCLVVYTAPALGAIALEPVTHVNNAAQLADGDPLRAQALGLLTLASGESLQRTLRIQVRQSSQART